MLATAVLNTPLALAVALRLAPALGVAVLAAWYGARGVQPGTAPPTTTATSLGIRPALQMAVLFQAVLYAVAAARTYLGAVGLLLTAAILGLTDVDALTMTLARGSGGGATLDHAARAITVGILAKATLKLLIATLFGAAPFRRACLRGLGAIAAAMALAHGVVGFWPAATGTCRLRSNHRRRHACCSDPACDVPPHDLSASSTLTAGGSPCCP